MNAIGEYIEIIVIVLAVIIVIQALLIGTGNRKLKKLTKSYRAMMDGTGVENLEAVIVSMKEEQRIQAEAVQAGQKRIEQLEKIVPQQKSKIAIHRYNAFSDSGSDLSFSVAITNEEKDGIVLTSIYSREGMYVYGKPITRGESNYSLTPEERKVINEAK